MILTREERRMIREIDDPVCSIEYIKNWAGRKFDEANEVEKIHITCAEMFLEYVKALLLEEEESLELESINDYAREIYDNAREKGLYEHDPVFPELIALCHAELSESLERNRSGECPSRYYYNYSEGKYEGAAIELIDATILILSICGRYNIDVEKLIKLKMRENKKRPYKHGKEY